MPDDRFASRPAPHHAPDRSPGVLVSTLLSDFSDLISKEIALAKGELSRNISEKVAGTLWMAIAGAIFLVAALTFVAGAVFLIASYGIAMHWSAFIVGGALALIALIMLFAGKSKMSGDTLPERSINQVKTDVRVVKEQMQ
ncbi:MAG: phage holin family protein [Beijerinckiaceae bacterium]